MNHSAARTPLPRALAWPRIASGLRSEVALARLGLGLVALHVADDTLLQPNPGTSAGDHLLAALVPLALLAAAAVYYGRLRAGVRATIALIAGLMGVLGGVEAVHYTRGAGPSGDDYSGLLSIPGAFLLLGLGAVTLWKSRRRDDAHWWRYLRRLLLDGRSRGRRVRGRAAGRALLRRHARGQGQRPGGEPRGAARERPRSRPATACGSRAGTCRRATAPR